MRALLHSLPTASKDHQDFTAQIVFDWATKTFWPSADLAADMAAKFHELTEQQLEKDIETSVHPHHAMHSANHTTSTERMARSHVDLHPLAGPTLPRLTNRTPLGPRKLRVGYISSDFSSHPTADLAVAGILAHTEKCEVMVYALSPPNRSRQRALLRRAQGVNFVIDLH
jgi:predicted O-linked N-acetylglucosamine transferase (SPINDLY family)